MRGELAGDLAHFSGATASDAVHGVLVNVLKLRTICWRDRLQGRLMAKHAKTSVECQFPGPSRFFLFQFDRNHDDFS